MQRLLLKRGDEAFPATLGLVRELPAAPASFLHPLEEKTAEGYTFEIRRSSYVLGRFAAKLVLGDWLGGGDPRDILIMPGVFGQPVVSGVGRGARVGISHSGAWAGALAFGEAHPMGLDIERVDPARTDLILGQATAAERQLLRRLSVPDADAATLLWTAKESLSKVFFTGLMCPLDFYEVETIDLEAGYHVAYFRHFAQYRAVCFGRDGLRCAVTLPRRTDWLTPLESLLE